MQERFLGVPDRDILIHAATKVEQVCDVDIPEIKKRLENGDHRIGDHELRLNTIETTDKVESKFSGNGSRPRARAIGNGGVGAGFMAALGAIGKFFGWW